MSDNFDDREVLEAIIKKLAKSGWGGIKKDNVESYVSSIVDDFCKMKKEREELRSHLMNSKGAWF